MPAPVQRIATGKYTVADMVVEKLNRFEWLVTDGTYHNEIARCRNLMEFRENIPKYIGMRNRERRARRA